MSKAPVELPGWTRLPFEHDDVPRDVYRAGTGPCVLVLSEIPGITPAVEAFARRLVGRGCSVAMPRLFGEPGRAPSGTYLARSVVEVCVSRQFTGLALDGPGPVLGWLRALAAEEHRRCGGPGVGVVGMCYTGGFALAMAIDPVVVAPVCSQPSLPLPLGSARQRSAGVGDRDLAAIRARGEAEGLCVLGLRFTGDKVSPPARFATLRRQLGDAFVSVELDSSPGNPAGHPGSAHSVLTEHLDDRPGTPTHDALETVLDFLTERLGARS